jgi:hypothetical protein
MIETERTERRRLHRRGRIGRPSNINLLSPHE